MIGIERSLRKKTERIHYLNPRESEIINKPHLFGIPHRCGYEFNLRPDTVKSDCMARGSHPRILFEYTISGSGELRMGDRITRMNEGQAMLLKIPGNYCYQMPADADSWELLFLSFWNPTAVQILEGIISEIGNVFPLLPNGPSMTKAWSLFELMQADELADSYAVSCTGYEFMTCLNRELRERHNGEKGHLEQLIRAYCMRNLGNPISVTELAEFCGYSRGHLTKVMKKTLGIAPSEFILDTKLDSALRILQQENTSIKAVALRCGFLDQGYFTRRFHRKFGVSPSHYARLL